MVTTDGRVSARVCRHVALSSHDRGQRVDAVFEITDLVEVPFEALLVGAAHVVDELRALFEHEVEDAAARAKLEVEPGCVIVVVGDEALEERTVRHLRAGLRLDAGASPSPGTVRDVLAAGETVPAHVEAGLRAHYE